MSKWIVPFVIISIFIFTGMAIYLQFVTSVELSSTLILSFYGFCTGELWMLSSIKKAKIKKPSDICEPVETEECEESNGVQTYVEDVENALAKIKEMIERGE
jgi:hypothetical protein